MRLGNHRQFCHHSFQTDLWYFVGNLSVDGRVGVLEEKPVLVNVLGTD